MSVLNSNVVVLRIKRVWRAMAPDLERRDCRRFGPMLVSARLAMIDPDGTNLALAPCTLSNVSFGGMCFSSTRSVRENEEYRFLIEFSQPITELVLVKARIVWCRTGERGYQYAGAEFLESSSGWLGPD